MMTLDIRLVETQDMRLVESQQIYLVETPHMWCVQSLELLCYSVFAGQISFRRFCSSTCNCLICFIRIKLFRRIWVLGASDSRLA